MKIVDIIKFAKSISEYLDIFKAFLAGYDAFLAELNRLRGGNHEVKG